MDHASLDTKLFKLLDVIQVKGEYKDGAISGSRDLTVQTDVGLRIPVTVTLDKFFMNDQCGIVAHVIGDLYIVVSYYEKTRSTGAYLIDKDKLEMDGVKSPPSLFISKTYDMRAVFEALKHAIVSAFTYRNNQWVALRLPK